MKTIINIVKILVFILLYVPMFGLALPIWIMSLIGKLIGSRFMIKTFGLIACGFGHLNVELCETFLPMVFKTEEIQTLYEENDKVIEAYNLL